MIAYGMITILAADLMTSVMIGLPYDDRVNPME